MRIDLVDVAVFASVSGQVLIAPVLTIRYFLKRRGAFALIFSLSAVATVSTLLALPANFRSREATANLRAIWTAMKTHQAEEGRYPSYGFAGFRTEFGNKYAYYCGRSVILPEYDEAPITPPPNWPYPVAPVLAPQSLLCFAAANLDADPFADIWAIDGDSSHVVRVASDQYDAWFVDLSRPLPTDVSDFDAPARQVSPPWIARVGQRHVRESGFHLAALLGLIAAVLAVQGIFKNAQFRQSGGSR